MQQPSFFQVYNASAGSGKTFTLVKQYLKVLLSSEDIFTFHKVLAITFTNKAAGEMKERVLQNLEDFADGKENDLYKIIIDEIAIDKATIQERSKKILDAILQNYSAFSITTIDSFTHKIIKNFAYDLRLPLSFEVEMDAVSLLNGAVDVLISKIGTDKKLTNLLIDYSLDKTDDDKSWDIAKDLNEFARILLNEDDVQHFRNLADKELEEFFSLKSKLQKINSQIEKEFKDFGDKVLGFIDDNGLSITDFSYGDYPKHFQKYQKLRFLKNGVIKFEGRLNNNIEADKNLYGGKTSPLAKDTIDDLKEQFFQYYYQSKELFDSQYALYVLNKIALKSIIPLAVLNNINSELENIKEDNNIRLNAEFNQLISDNIKDQPAPFIYERIGQRFQHYFIDEMQDTSVLQWQNLIPLIDNALAQENSNLLLVGDGKQAIYRWRGGKAEQFINLGSDIENPFHISKEIKHLETNFRSFSEVINFNNSFFQHTANFLQNESYKKLFLEGNTQKENAKKGGFVSLTFLEDEKDKEEKKLRYPKKVLEKINQLKKDFSLNEICVLTRTKKDGIAVANYLSENNIDIVSSETLLLQNNTKVNFIINLLQLLQNPSDEETRFEVLYFLHQHLKISEKKHIFLNHFAKSNTLEIIEGVKNYGVSFEVSNFQQLPFYEKIEAIIRGFNLVNSSDAFVQFFLDVVLEQQRKGTDVGEFLEFWELKKDKLSIVAPESANAVQVMTIHKSKGLEFPVVIFPCDVEIYRQIKPKSWLNELPETYNGFNELLVDYSKSLELVSSRGLEIYNQQREELELDNFNLLYVALTRAVEQLHIITEHKISSKGEENTNFYSGVFINYLKEQNLWKDDVFDYCFGAENRIGKKENNSSVVEIHQKFISTPWQEHNMVLLASSSKLWDTDQGKAIDYGNLLHEMFAKINTEKDINKVVAQYHQQGFIDDDQLLSIKEKIIQVVNHPQLKQYYQNDVIIYNEREIVDVDNQIMIPDRLVFADDSVSIIDYKTGNPSKEHHQQVLKYERVLQSMHLKVDKKILIYINDKIGIVEV
ncbi:UvrD-helicase domain-containing protein [Polaribacter aquimarinus]|uniref:DNA 3'-5' helicase n=1 Tax=Polaribacter aquimarinus TaxID=2100726 RepID=A0A2U2JB52_9FLAO|nr:UvrD-helicase domain-containing protein [Polaribacter aquimarinus]PWG05569.1 DNA helicase UvrD [Polaribacter aquimarinus]